MRTKSMVFHSVLAAAVSLGCSNPADSPKESTISLTAIPGIIAPVSGAIPAAIITGTTQYSGTVVWSPQAGNAFAPNTVYTAYINLTPKAGYTLQGVGANSFTVQDAVATHESNSGAVTAVFGATNPTEKHYAIGDIGPSGKGIVFLVTDGGSHGLEVSPSSWTGSSLYEPKSVWKNTQTLTSHTSTDIGKGYANTYLELVGTEHPAAERSRGCAVGGKGDWFLPSLDELEQIYLNRDLIGGYFGYEYWSSSEYDAGNAIFWDFGTGRAGTGLKYVGRIVRPVRAF